MNDKIKTILIFCGVAFILWILYENEQSKIEDNIYEAKINKYNYTICGTNFSISDYLYNDEIEVNELLESIKEECD